MRICKKTFPTCKKIFLFDDQVPGKAPNGTFSLPSIVEKRVKQPIDKGILAQRRLDAIENVAILTTTSGTTGIPSWSNGRLHPGYVPPKAG